jgi:hypothetical protein
LLSSANSALAARGESISPWTGGDRRTGAFDLVQMAPCQRAYPEPNALQKTCKEKKPPQRAVSKYLQVERAVSELIAINVQVFGAFP